MYFSFILCVHINRQTQFDLTPSTVHGGIVSNEAFFAHGTIVSNEAFFAHGGIVTHNEENKMSESVRNDDDTGAQTEDNDAKLDILSDITPGANMDKTKLYAFTCYLYI